MSDARIAILGKNKVNADTAGVTEAGPGPRHGPDPTAPGPAVSKLARSDSFDRICTREKVADSVAQSESQGLCDS
jgi:hypothetical protein